MNVGLTDYKWLDKASISTAQAWHWCDSTRVVHSTPADTWRDPRVLSPLLELFGGDESGPQVAVSHALGLPPRGVVLGHDLEDVAPLEGKSRFLAGSRLVFQRDVVKQGSHVHLESKTKRFTVNKNGQSCLSVWLRGPHDDLQIAHCWQK